MSFDWCLDRVTPFRRVSRGGWGRLGLGWKGLVVIFAGSASLAAAAQPARAGAAQPAAEASPLVTEIRRAKTAYVPIDAEALSAAQAELAAAAEALDAWLTKHAEDEPNWRPQLDWTGLGRELARPGQENVAALADLLARYRSGAEGLERDPFQRVARALERLLQLRRATTDAAAPLEFPLHLELLEATVAAVGPNGPTLEEAERIGAALSWLEAHEQAPALVAALRAEFSRPNLLFFISTEMVNAGVGREIDDDAPIRETIMGTRVSGQGHTLGTVRVRLVENEERAELLAEFDAENQSQTVGANGPARIFTRARTRLLGKTRIFLDPLGLEAEPTSATADTRSTVTGIGATPRNPCFRRLVCRVASRQVPRQKPCADQIAEGLAARRVSERVDEELQAALVTTNRQFREKFRYPLLRRGLYPRDLRFATTGEHLTLLATEETPGRLAAPVPPPPPSGSGLMRVAFHESLVNNAAQEALGGKTINKAQLQELALDLLGSIPERLQEEGALQIKFAARDPVTLRIADNTVTATIRGDQYIVNDRRFDEGMNVTVRYRLEATPGGLRATRVGDFEFLPPSFKPGSGQRLGLRQALLVSTLRAKFNRMLPAVVEPTGIEMKEPLDELGTLIVDSLATEGGWLSISWKSKPAAPADGLAVTNP